MSLDELLSAFGLPSSARIDRRVPRTLLAEHGAPTASDRRQISEGIEELRWLAALKPTTVGVPSHEDAVRQYLEINFLALHLRPSAKPGRLIELVHRAVPYPLLLVTLQPPALALSLAHKRWSQGEAGKTVLDGRVIEAALRSEQADRHFLDSLMLSRQPRTSLLALYQGWIDCVTALLVSRISGTFSLRPPARAAAQRDTLETHARLQREIVQLRAQAARETQIARRADLNLEIGRLQANLTAAAESLRSE